MDITKSKNIQLKAKYSTLKIIHPGFAVLVFNKPQWSSDPALSNSFENGYTMHRPKELHTYIE